MQIKIVSALIFGVLFLVAVGQNATPSIPSDKMPDHRDMKGEREKMAKELNLTPEQREKLKAIHMKHKAEMKAKKQQDKEFRKNMSEKNKAEIDAILTPEQRAKMDQIRTNRKANRMQRKGNNNWDTPMEVPRSNNPSK